MLKTNIKILTASAAHELIAAADLDAVPVVTTDRHLPRKEQAALARKLFRSLGILGVSVTAPRYSMAMSVDVDIPRREDYKIGPNGYVEDWENDPAAVANRAASEKIRQILERAFPCHDDRSDSMSDYFDFKWSFNH